MPKSKYNCKECNNELMRWKSQIRSEFVFCNKSCARTYKNKTANPSWTRDLSGENNPMWGSHPIAWNIDIKGEDCHNWKGGLHKRKDGYYRINLDGERKLYHRHLLEKSGIDIEGKVVHHKNHNPSDNVVENLMVFNTQGDHVKYEHAHKHENNQLMESSS